MSLSAPSNAEAKMLRDAFLPEDRDGTTYFVYYNDEKYYLILSLCEKHRIQYRTKANCILIAAPEFERFIEPERFTQESPQQTFSHSFMNPENDGDEYASEAADEVGIADFDYKEKTNAVSTARAALFDEPVEKKEPEYAAFQEPITIAKKTIPAQQPVYAETPQRSTLTPEQTAESRSRSLEIREQALLARENAIFDREQSISLREDNLQNRRDDFNTRKESLERREKNLIQLQGALESSRAIIIKKQAKVLELKKELTSIAQSDLLS